MDMLIFFAKVFQREAKADGSTFIKYLSLENSLKSCELVKKNTHTKIGRFTLGPFAENVKSRGHRNQPLELMWMGFIQGAAVGLR